MVPVIATRCYRCIGGQGSGRIGLRWSGSRQAPNRFLLAIFADRGWQRKDDDRVRWELLQAWEMEASSRASFNSKGATIKNESSPGSKQKLATRGDKHCRKDIYLKWR